MQIAQHDPARFAAGAPAFLTQDEESSGVIDASDVLGKGWFLFDTHTHFANGTELVEGGQLRRSTSRRDRSTSCSSKRPRESRRFPLPRAPPARTAPGPEARHARDWSCGRHAHVAAARRPSLSDNRRFCLIVT